MAETSVKFFHSGMPGIPQLNGNIGTLIAILDALLVNGFNLKSVDSLTVAANIATVNVASGPGVEAGQVVLLAGATPAGLNGEQRVLTASSTGYTFATTGIADQTATGTITTKVAPAGWTKPFAGTNLGAYQMNGGTNCVMRVNDNQTGFSYVTGYETMSAVSTGVNPFPTTAALAVGATMWGKSSSADSVTRAYMLAADGRFVHFHTNSMAAYYSTNWQANCFGDMVAQSPDDVWACINVGGVSNPVAPWTNLYANDSLYYSSSSTNALGCWAARGYAGNSFCPRMTRVMGGLYSQSGFPGGAAQSWPYPNPVDGGLMLCKYQLFEDVSMCQRGDLPGMYGSNQNVYAKGAIQLFDMLDGTGDMVGRKIRCLPVSYPQSGPTGCLFFDATGPWR